MRIKKLTARDVHGYLPISVNFNPDLTFLIGLNGSGKTTALRILMALLVPNIEELGLINFSEARATIEGNKEEIEISAIKNQSGVTLSVSNVRNTLSIDSSELELYMDTRHREEGRSPVVDRIQNNEVFHSIKNITTPMFLGLDRRFFIPRLQGDESIDFRRRDYISRRYWPEEIQLKDAFGGSLAEVNYLVISKIQEIRAAQEALDERLRDQFFTNAFSYNPGVRNFGKIEFPSRTELQKYKSQLSAIERAADDTRIPMPKIQSALTDFFEKMNKIIDRFERKGGKLSEDQLADKDGNLDQNIIEWIINRPETDRILRHLALLDKYIIDRNKLRESIDRFLKLTNSFLSQTSKSIVISNDGHLNVNIKNHDEPRPISALSSGERQLVIMLAHLSFNPNLSGSGIFIVDEPELSLHIDWQEKFVEAIQEANPNVQLILATHSPGIILDRDESCISLCEANR
jgi:predicted ATP-binding protein involved in virulence